MTETSEQGPGGKFVIRRILAALGPATMSAGVLEGAVDLADRFGAELETLFVEDLALLQWTELPFIRQIGLHGLAGIPVSPHELELQFRALAAEAQARLAIAARPQLRWSFRVARGQVAGEVITAAAHADLLVLGSSSRPVARETLLEPSVRLLIGAVKAPILLLRPAQPPRGPVHVVLESQDAAERLLEAAMVMVDSYAESSIITAWRPEAAPERELDDALASSTAAALRVRRFASPEGIDTLIGSVAGGTLVLSARSSLLELQTWWRHFARARCALLLVR